jgi:ATP-dependent DNA helicase RecQ
MYQLKSNSLENALKNYFGYDYFRPGQKEIVQQALAHQDLLIIMPTGGGKSLCFQLPALLQPGLTIVVSPLISLMQDQVDSLRDNGIGATFLNSSLSFQEIRHRENEILSGKIKLLYLAPERLVSEKFTPFLDLIKEKIGISAFAIDEAHCISEWGHDFRQEYRQLRQLRQNYSTIPIFALTATATKRVQDDIIQQLKLRQPYIHIASFNRSNLYYEVIPKESRSYAQLLKLIRQQKGSGIIYCFNRKTTEELAQDLQDDGFCALPYHAGLTDSYRVENQNRFIRDDVQIIVATIAFGMGINKPDVRFVIHYNLPRNIEGYYQESGRAGRDGEPSNCILLYGRGDLAKINYFIDQKNNYQEKMIAKMQLKKMVEYAEANLCRRTVQLSYFGEKFKGNCGNCDNCLNPKPMEDWTIEAQKFLSCVARTKEKFGMTQIIDVLRGSRSKKIEQYGHHLLSTYGIGKDKTADQWKCLARALIYQGLLNETNDGFQVLKLNQKSWEILRNKRTVTIAVNNTNVEKILGDYNPKFMEMEMLLERLKTLRKHLADRENIAPYVIFGDSTLKLMVQLKPKTPEEFSKISGVTEYKLEKYGASFISEIRSFCQEQELPSALPTNTQMKTLQLYQQGLNVEEIAQERKLAVSTIIGHLTELIELNQPININDFVIPVKQEIIIKLLNKIGDQSLTILKEQLGDGYSYDELKLVRSWWKRNKL